MRIPFFFTRKIQDLLSAKLASDQATLHEKDNLILFLRETIQHLQQELKEAHDREKMLLRNSSEVLPNRTHVGIPTLDFESEDPEILAQMEQEASAEPGDL